MVVEDDGTTFIDSRETYFVYYTFPIDEIFTLGFIEIFSLYSRKTDVRKLISDDFTKFCHLAGFTCSIWYDDLPIVETSCALLL
jgi:hypothetical protein